MYLRRFRTTTGSMFECLVIGWGGGVSGKSWTEEMVVEERKEGGGEPLVKFSNGVRIFGPGTVGGDRERLEDVYGMSDITF